MTDLAVFVLPAKDRERFIESFTKRLMSLPAKQWEITVKEKKKRRSNDQNALAWTVYQQILDRGGEAMRGWTKEDLHSFFLIDYFGAETLNMYGRKKLKPRRTSSKLTTAEFSDYLEHVAQFMAAQGVVIHLPGDLT